MQQFQTIWRGSLLTFCIPVIETVCALLEDHSVSYGKSGSKDLKQKILIRKIAIS